MKLLQAILFLFFNLSLCAQNNPVAKRIANHHQQNDTFEQYQLFSKDNDARKSALYTAAAKDAVVLDLNPEELTRLRRQKPETIEISFPHKERTITVELYKEKVFTAGFHAVDQDKVPIDYEPGVYYRGIVENDPRSVVAFSFFENDVVGVASAPGAGNMVVGKIENSGAYISYTDYTLTGNSLFQCGVDELPGNKNKQISYKSGKTSSKGTMTTNCVRVYYEIAYHHYLKNGKSTTETLNWITAVHNNIAALYANDDIQISLSNILIWTSPDPYNGTNRENLYQFRNSRLAFDGDLAHFVDDPSGSGGVAFINSLCQGYRYAYTAIPHYYQNIPVFSWTIAGMAHEMGHSLGSPHTHACAWNGNDTAIDGCGPAVGDDEGCDAPLPESGTIMSYCHMVQDVGINFANGFGPQPSALIRNTVDSKPCLGTDCITSCMTTVSDVYFTNISATDVTGTIVDDLSNNWEYMIFPYGVYYGNWITTSTKSFTISDLEPNKYYQIATRNVCASGGFGSYRIRLFLTDGDYCAGAKFVDTGGETSDYGDNQTLIKTFHPDGSGKLTLAFTEFDLEQDYDFMTIYNGENMDAPVFANGENLTGNTIPGPFVSTDPSGAITVKFTSSNDAEVGKGWIATIACDPLEIADFGSGTGINIYPIPSSSMVHIQSKEIINRLKVYDIRGRTVIEKNQINTSRTSLELDALINGVYFIRISNGENSQIMKIVKE